MSLKNQSRREFLNTAGSMISSSWFVWHLPAILATAELACKAHRDGADFVALTPDEATELEAIAAQIFPTDDSPGAREAGVIYFMDRALDTFQSDDLGLVRDGLTELESKVRKAHPDLELFSRLTADQQVEALREIDTSDFFEAVRNLTIAGMFSHPSYGGNRDKIGWQLLHFEDRMAWQPPFGYYDAEYMKEQASNGE